MFSKICKCLLAMLTVRNLNLEIGGRPLLNDVSFTLRKGQRVGLVGRNGQGKTTLLKILCGRVEYSSGTVQRSRDFQVAYLPQEVVSPEDMSISIFEAAKQSFSHLLKKEERLRQVTGALEGLKEEEAGHEALLMEQDRLHEELLHQGYYAMRSRIEAVLTGLGFDRNELLRPVSSLSGGWLMRLELAKILLSEPALILLDEPTNHLDLPSLSWLESFLLAQEAGCLIVSHDRTFLDNVVSEIWELERGRLVTYKGNYSNYVQERQSRLKQRETAWRNQQKKIEEINTFIQRFRAKATKARQVQSRIKQLERLERIEAPVSCQCYSFTLPSPKRPGKVVLEVEGLSKGFDKKGLFSDLSFILKRGTKLAVVGPNGAGKSTLLKIIFGKESPDAGQIRLGHNVELAYFGQHQVQELDYNRTVLENLQCLCKNRSERELRTILGIFMFHGEDVFKEVSVLSGGEKSRVALAAIMAQGANLLLLDEPTNHLDMEAQEAVRQALAEFQGSVIVVSHNRYFLDGFVDCVLELEGGNATLFPGNVTQFLELKRTLAGKGTLEDEVKKETAERKVSNDVEPSAKKFLSRKEKKRLVAEIRQEKSRKLAPLKKKAETLETQISHLEGEQVELERLLSDSSTYGNGQKAAELNRRYVAIKDDLKSLYGEWEGVSEQIEELVRQYDKRITEIEE